MLRDHRFSSTRWCWSVLVLAVAVAAGCREAPDAQSGAARSATFVEQSVPTEMVADRAYTVSVRMRNTGTVPWRAGENYRLGAVRPLDNETWGLRRVALTSTVAPGAEVALTFTVKSPRSAGEYDFQWRMVQDGVEWFGDETRKVTVAVTQPAS
jgi:Ig-like domain from next to BRCA1 gene